VIIHDLDIISVTVNPFKTDTPLVINACAELTVTVAVQGLQPITCRNKQILQRPCPVQVNQLASRRSLKSLITLYEPIIKKHFGVFVVEALYHLASFYPTSGITSSVTA
jgi:hypothetical protein